jgi:hypothetical protein
MTNLKYKEAIRLNYDTRVVVLDLIWTDELDDLLFNITKKMGKFIWAESYDGYLDDGDEDRVEIVISDPNSPFFKKPIEYLLNYFSKKLGTDVKLYQSKKDWVKYNNKFYDYYYYIDDMK